MTEPRDIDLIAAEYVAGLLEPAEAAAVERRLGRDPALVAAIARWRERLAELDATAVPVTPASDLWTRIEAATYRPEPAARAAARPSVRALLWESLAFWRRLGLATALATVLLAVGLGVQTWRAERNPVMVAVLLSDTSRPVALVNSYGSGRVELVPLQSIDVPEGRALEVWTLWDRAVGPRSVGLLDRTRSAALRLDNLPLGPDQLFEITLEPATGSPTGRPTGPVLAIGRTSRTL
jgi:anti-sigma-K factor RskA